MILAYLNWEVWWFKRQDRYSEEIAFQAQGEVPEVVWMKRFCRIVSSGMAGRSLSLGAVVRGSMGPQRFWLWR